MATMTMPMHVTDVPFKDVRDTVDFLRLRVKRSQKLARILREIYQEVVLSWELAQISVKQEQLISGLNGPTMQNLSYAELIDFATKIEGLVASNDELLLMISSPRGRWAVFIEETTRQRDTLESMAESYRCASDFETNSLFGMLLEQIEPHSA